MKSTIDQLKKGVIVDTEEAKRLRSQYRDNWEYSIVPAYIPEETVNNKWIFRLVKEHQPYGWE